MCVDGTPGGRWASSGHRDVLPTPALNVAAREDLPLDTPVVALENRTAPPEERAGPPTGSAPPARGYPVMPEAELEFGEVGQALRHRRHLILAGAVLGLLVGLMAGLLTKKIYTATAIVEFAQPNIHALGLDDPSGSANDLSTLELLNTELKTQETEITDDATALAVIERLHLDTQKPFAIPVGLPSSDPLSHERSLPLDQAPYQRERVIRIFKQHLSVDVVKGTRLLSITFTDSDPARAATIANAVVSASLDQTSGRHHATTNQVTGWLSDQLAALKRRVEESQRLAEEYASENQRDLAGMTMAMNGSGRMEAPNGAESVPVSRLLALNNELTSAQVAHVAKEAIYRVAKTGDPEAVLSLGSSSLVSGQGADSTLAPANGGLSLLQHLREQQVQVNVQATTAAAKYGAKNQVMVEYARQQAALQEQIAAELDRIRERAKSDLDLAVGAENGLRAKVTAQQADVSQWTTKADHLLLLQGEAASSRALYQDLFAKLQESEFAAGVRASRVTLLDAAGVPTTASSPNRKKDLALGGLLGTVLGLIAAFAMELVDDSLHSEDQIRKSFGVPVLGTIPLFPRGAKGNRPWVVFEPRSPTAEAYRSLRTTAFARTAGDCKTLLVASSSPGEGKATTCLNAGAALAMQGHRVLLIHADMRRAGSAQTFGITGGGGLSRCLLGHLSAEEAVQPSGEVENLYVLPAGPVPENPSELLGSTRFGTLLCELKETFDYILLDSPPVLLFADAKILSAHSDAYVFVVQASRTAKKDLRKALGSFYGSSAAFLGVVLNGVPMKAPQYTKFGYGV